MRSQKQKEADKRYQEAHKEELRIYRKNYQLKNRERIIEYRNSRKEISRKLDNKHYARTKDRHRELQMARRYQISIEEYKSLFKNQNNLCAICDKPETARMYGVNKYLAVDHCHKTGKVRGLLCKKCNQAIGLLDENIDLLDKIKIYLNVKTT